MKKALTTIVAAAALVILVVPAADATLERSLPTTYSHAKTKAAKVAKKTKKSKNAVRAASIYIPPAVVCPEPDPGDSWGYCIPVSSQSDAAPSTAGSVTSVTYNDGAGT